MTLLSCKSVKEVNLTTNFVYMCLHEQQRIFNIADILNHPIHCVCSDENKKREKNSLNSQIKMNNNKKAKILKGSL